MSITALVTVDRLLRRPEEADAACSEARAATAMLPSLAWTAVAGIGVFALVQGSLSQAFHPMDSPGLLRGASVLEAVGLEALAYGFGLFGAQIAALPSYWFYALLAGVPMPGWRLAVEATRAQATAAVVLMGLLPVYLAVGLGLGLLLPGPDGAPWHWLVVQGGGHLLPFVAGLAAPLSLIRGFRRVVSARSVDGKTRAMPLFLALWCAALFTAMAPLGVMRVLGLFAF